MTIERDLRGAGGRAPFTPGTGHIHMSINDPRDDRSAFGIDKLRLQKRRQADIFFNFYDLSRN